MNFAVDWIDRVDFIKMREMRTESLRKAMKRHNLDALITFRAENIRYMTGMRPLWWPITFVSRNASIMTPNSRPVLYVTSGDAPRCRATMTWMDPEEIKPCGTMEEPGIVESMVKQFVQTLKEQGFTQGRIGIDAGTFVMIETIKKAFPGSEVIDGDECVIEAKSIKNSEEIKLMKQSSKIAEIGMQTAIDHIKTGARNCEILGEVMKAFYSRGMEVPQCNLIVTSGEETAPLHRFASDRTVRYGDLVFMDLGGCFNGYFSDFTRTVIHGKPNDMQKKIYNAVYEEMMVVQELLKPGHTNEEVNIAARNVIKKHNFEQWGFHGVLGHSIGISGFEAPLIGEIAATGGKTFEFQPGMVFSCEPAILVPNIPGGGGVRIEDTILVTDEGNEVLSRHPYCSELLG